jgi:HlyD family secretion protein
MRFAGNRNSLVIAMLCLASCAQQDRDADAYGSFEANDIIVSAQSEGVIVDFEVEEGAHVEAGQYIAGIDTSQLIVQKKQIALQLQSFWAQNPTVPDRFRRLNDSLLMIQRLLSGLGVLSDDANLLQKERDSLRRQQSSLEKAIEAQRESYSTGIKVAAIQVEQLYLQLYQLQEALAKCRITSPIQGVLVTKYGNQYELIGAGSPLARVADISKMYLKVYITEDQLSGIELGKSCTVYIDGAEELRKYQGVVTWIASESEFTPKMIQTKKERVNLVYAVKIKVENDGGIKIGMPGEVIFN